MPLDQEEDGGIIIDKEYLNKMLKFHRKVNPKEGLLGFYISGSSIDQTAVMLFKFYQDLSRDKKNKSPLLGQPLMLMIDPTMQGNRLSIKVKNTPKINFLRSSVLSLLTSSPSLRSAPSASLSRNLRKQGSTCFSLVKTTTTLWQFCNSEMTLLKKKSANSWKIKNCSATKTCC